MKILCIGRNYVDHAKELNNPVPEQPVFFLKPETAILRPGYDFFYPDFTNDIHHEIEMVIKINKTAKGVHPKFAGNYFGEIGLGIDFTARDVQAQCKAKGLPWEHAKAFDTSAPIGYKFINKKDLNLDDIGISLTINGETRQQGSTASMIFSINEIIAYLSRFITLKKGDLIFTGTPEGVGKVNIGDHVCGYLNGEKLIDFKVK